MQVFDKMLNFIQTLNRQPMKDETLVVLSEYNTITEAEIAKSMLDSAGIRSTIRNEYMSAIYPVGTMPAQLVVRGEDAEQAAQILRRR